MRRIASSPRGCCTTGCSISGSTCTPSGSSARSSSGRWAPRFIALYFASLIAGSFGALLVDPLSFTVGASGAIFGLFGAATVVALASGNRDIGNRLGAIVGINLVLTFAVPVLSIGGHVGGLLGGVALAGAFVPQVRAKRPEWESIAVAMLLVAFFAAGALWAGSQWPDPLF